MRKCYLLGLAFAAAILSCGYLNAQTNWTWLSPRPQGNVMIAIDAIDTNTVVAVGNTSTILRTTDGGSHWDVRHRAGGTANYLADVKFNNLGVGIAVGENGKVLSTTDSGKTWSAHSVGASAFLWEVEYIEAHKWFAVTDGTLYKTTDDGTTWTGSSPAGPMSLEAIDFFSPDVGYLVGGLGNILRTTDGGLTWQNKSVTSGYSLRGVHFFTADTGFVWGDIGTFFETNDGGNTWKSRSDVPLLETVTFLNRYLGYAAGGFSYTNYKTTDGGKHWTTILNLELIAIAFANENVGFGVGWNGYIVKTQNGGTSWQFQSSFTPSYFFQDAASLDKLTTVVVGYGGKMYRTTNGGEDWYSVAYGSDGTTYTSIGFEDSVGVTVGSGGRILRSTNRGEQWSPMSTGTQRDLYGIALRDNIALATGDSGLILRSTDKGITWSQLSSGTGLLIRSVGFFDEDTAIIAAGEINGTGGEVLRSTDKGISWTDVLGPLQYECNRIAISGSTAMVTSLRGRVYVSTNSGQAWTSRWLGVQDDLYGIALHTDQRGVVVSGFGGVFSTSDGGDTWTDELSPTSNWLYSPSYVGADTVLIVGWGSTILRMTSSGATTDVVEIPGQTQPSQFALGQNYPNPFNPSTTINYVLPKLSNVTLKVFDVLGREVATLVNALEEPGFKSVTFDASRLSSGTYYYHLQAGNQTETKKLLLLR